jgi:hypothetical protein
MPLTGYLRDVPLVELLRALRRGMKSGILQLVRGSVRGVIYIYHGCPIDAMTIHRLHHARIAGSDTAIVQMFGWQDARFSFQQDATLSTMPVRIEHDFEWLLLERNLYQSEGVQIQESHAILTTDSTVRLSQQPVRAGNVVRLEIEHWRIIEQLSNPQHTRSVSALARAIHIDRATTLYLLSQLVSLGMVEMQMEATADTAASPAASSAPARPLRQSSLIARARTFYQQQHLQERAVGA